MKCFLAAFYTPLYRLKRVESEGRWKLDDNQVVIRALFFRPSSGFQTFDSIYIVRQSIHQFLLHLIPHQTHQFSCRVRDSVEPGSSFGQEIDCDFSLLHLLIERATHHASVLHLVPPVDHYHFGYLFVLGWTSNSKMGVGKHKFCNHNRADILNL